MPEERITQKDILKMLKTKLKEMYSCIDIFEDHGSLKIILGMDYLSLSYTIDDCDIERLYDNVKLYSRDFVEQYIDTYCIRLQDIWKNDWFNLLLK